MLNHQVKFSAVVLLSVLLVVAVFLMQPTTPVFAGITPTATAVPPTNTPVPPTNTPVPPPSSSAEETPIPTPEVIPDLGAGPNSSQAGLMGIVLLGVLLLLAVFWSKAWYLYRRE